MGSIIGLVKSDIEFTSSVEGLKLAGIPEGRIRQLSSASSINQLFQCDPACMIMNYTLGGAATGILTYAIFGAAAALCECGLMQFGKEYGILTLLGALLAGTFVGGSIGLLAGVGEAEKDTQYYVQGLRQGGKIIAVQVSDEQIKGVRYILDRNHVMGLLFLQVKGARVE